MGRAFVPVIHAAVPDRPDEQDTVDTAVAIAAAMRRQGYDSEVVDIGTDFASLTGLAARRPELVFNLVEAVGGDGSRAAEPIRAMERLGLRYTGASAAASELTLSKVGTKELSLEDSFDSRFLLLKGTVTPFFSGLTNTQEHIQPCLQRT